MKPICIQVFKTNALRISNMAKALNIANGFNQGAYQLLNPCQFGENQGLAVPLILDMIGCRFWICLGQYLIGSALSVDKIIPRQSQILKPLQFLLELPVQLHQEVLIFPSFPTSNLQASTPVITVHSRSIIRHKSVQSIFHWYVLTWADQ